MQRVAFFAAVVAVLLGAGPAVAQVEQSGGTAPFDTEVYFELAPSLMHRSTPGNATLFMDNVTSDPFITEDDVDFGFDPAIEAALGVKVVPDGSFEMRLLYIGSAADPVNYTTSTTFRGFSFFGIGTFDFQFTSESLLTSLETNWRQDLSDRLTLIAGLRAMSLTDTIAANVLTSNADYSYENGLLGVQGGAELKLLDESNPLQLNLSGLAGVYQAHADGGVRAYVNGVFTQEAVSASDAIAFSGEIGIDAAYRLTDNFEISAGYNMLLLSGVALGSTNAAMSIQDAFVLANTVFRDSVVYQGAQIGLTGRF